MESKVSVADALLIPLHSLEYAYTQAQILREKGIKIEVYPELTKPKKSFNYANAKGYKYVLIVGEEEEQNKAISLKNMHTGEQKSSLKMQEILEILK